MLHSPIVLPLVYQCLCLSPMPSVLYGPPSTLVCCSKALVKLSRCAARSIRNCMRVGCIDSFVAAIMASTLLNYGGIVMAAMISFRVVKPTNRLILSSKSVGHFFLGSISPLTSSAPCSMACSKIQPKTISTLPPCPPFPPRGPTSVPVIGCWCVWLVTSVYPYFG